MGCCLSTPNSITSDEKQLQQSMKGGSDMYYVRDSKAPPPSSMEEESVKEVLSETPIPKQPELQQQQQDIFKKSLKPSPEKTSSLEQPINYRKFNSNNIDDKKPSPALATASGNQVNHHPVTEEISEVSEICSLSESVSTTFTEKRDEYYESELKQQRPERSPAPANKYSNSKPRSFSGELINGNRQRLAANGSPVRRSDPSPGRRNVGPNSTKDGNFRRRRDPGESSGRRSRSPVTRVDGAGSNGNNRSTMGRSPSAKRSAGKSPGRVRAAAAPSSQHQQELNNKNLDNEEHFWKQQQPQPQQGDNINSNNNDNANESLENPLVSLECFIFL